MPHSSQSIPDGTGSKTGSVGKLICNLEGLLWRANVLSCPPYHLFHMLRYTAKLFGLASSKVRSHPRGLQL